MIDRVALAALNNAGWCDAVSRAHGAPCRFERGYWINEGAAPPFYPNLVTLDGGAAPRAAIEALAGGRAGPLGIKDSYAALDLAPLGFAPAFSAEWLWLDPATDIGPTPPSDSVAIVADAAGLLAWEAAWRGGAAGETIFPESLLGDGRIAFLGLRRGGRLVAGAATNLSEGAIGLSNLFMADDDAAALPALIHATRGLAPGLPVVGYEHGESLELFLKAGFESIGALRVWVRS